MVKNFLKVIIIFLIPIFSLCGCQYPLYKADIQQGNIIKDEQLSRLKLGMTKFEVKSLFGSPMLNSETDDHWLYVYYYKPGYGKSHRKKINLSFKKNQLSHFQAK